MNSEAQKAVPTKFEPSNLSRDNLSRETGRSASSTTQAQEASADTDSWDGYGTWKAPSRARDPRRMPSPTIMLFVRGPLFRAPSL